MPARYVASHAPGLSKLSPDGEPNETIFDWIRRQNRPVKITAHKTPTQTTFEAAVAAMVHQKKKDAEAVAAAISRRPSDSHEGES